MKLKPLDKLKKSKFTRYKSAMGNEPRLILAKDRRMLLGNCKGRVMLSKRMVVFLALNPKWMR